MKNCIIKGENIIKRRKMLGLSQEKLAEKVGVSPQTISNWENEATNIKMDNVNELAKALKLTGRELVNESFEERATIKTQLEQAILYAVNCHAGATQKGSIKPYILHPLEVMQILLEMNANDNLLMAGVLHDVVEDSEATLSDIEFKFGIGVRRLVECHTENKELEWEERKKHAIDELIRGNIDVKMLILADALSNLRRMSRSYAEVGEKLWERFNRGKEQQAWYYGEMVAHFMDLEDVSAEVEDGIKEAEKLYKIIFGNALSSKLRVVYKAPKEAPRVIKVAGIVEINKLLGNVDEEGIPFNKSSSDICESIGDNIDLYMNQFACVNSDLDFNIYGSPMGNGMIGGPVIIVGFDPVNKNNECLASLTDKQMQEALLYLAQCS